jgi:acetyl-CoA synthetase
MAIDHLERLAIAWHPDKDAFAKAPIGRMAARHGITDPGELWRRAVEEPRWFWPAAVEDVGVRWMRPYDDVLDLSDGIEFPHFFRGGQLNWADYAVDRWVDAGRGDARAVWWEGDDGSTRELTYSELKEEVDKAAGALNAMGVEKGDTVGLVLPMIPEAVVAVLATAKVGGVVVPMFSGYGAPAIRERVEQSGARVIITANAFLRRGKAVPLKTTVDEAVTGLPVDNILVVRRLDSVSAPMASGRDRDWHDSLSSATPMRQALPMDSEDPCLLLYTSGSTGRPKGCVHTHAGLPFKVAQECRHAMGMDQGDTLLWLTDMGWVMGSFIIAGALVNGGTAAMYEGTPDWPDPDRLWAVAERGNVNVLGISPTAVRSLMRHGSEWAEKHPLESVRVIGTTGEPWNLDPWMWCFRHVGKERAAIVNISGGTECGGSIVAGSIVAATKPMAFSGPTLGMAADVVDEDGKSVRGSVGELVVRAPWPGMTKGFWGNRDLYLDTYWQRFKGMWHQGDFAYVDGESMWYLLGRSDDTIQLAGKRVGPAEVESALVKHDDVVEAAAVGVPDDVKGDAIVAFVVLKDGTEVASIVDALRAQVRAELGPAITPKTILQVPELPKTRSGKVMRRVVRAIYLGEAPGDMSALDNPTALDSLPVAATA